MSEINVNNEKNTGKPFYSNAGLKDLIGRPEVQNAIKGSIDIPSDFWVKKVGKSSAEYHTQKIEGLSGTTFENAVSVKCTIYDETNTHFLDPVEAINKRYRITDYALGLEANMNGREFQGYSATGLKLIVYKLEKVK